MSATLCFDSASAAPKIIVRQLLPGEALPFYSTDELWRGVCHFVPVVPVVKTYQKIGLTPDAIKAQLAGSARAREKFATFVPDIEAMLLKNLKVSEIASALNITRSYLEKNLKKNAGLMGIAAAMKEAK